MSAGPQDGVTRLAHVDGLLADAAAVVASARDTVAAAPRLGPTARETLRRQLAGVVGALEAVRIWLDAGAPR